MNERDPRLQPSDEQMTEAQRRAVLEQAEIDHAVALEEDRLTDAQSADGEG